MWTRRWVIHVKKNNISLNAVSKTRAACDRSKKKTLRICMCMTILQHNVLTWWFFKFTWAGTGLENTHYFHKGWLHLAPGFGPFCCFCCVYILTYITFVQCFKESNQFPTSINILDCDTISSFQKCQTLEI